MFSEMLLEDELDRKTTEALIRVAANIPGRL